MPKRHRRIAGGGARDFLGHSRREAYGIAGLDCEITQYRVMDFRIVIVVQHEQT